MDLWYHGTCREALRYCPTAGKSDEADILSLSACSKVAQRYGERIFVLALDAHELPRVTVLSWLRGGDIPSTSFLIEGDERNPDLPVDTLVLRSAPDATFTRLVP